ncbi:MAG: Na+/H+ antiporter subunit E [candidate division WOR-3 bacterium]
MKTARAVAYWVGAMAIWMLLTWTMNPATLVAGAVMSLIAALWFGRELPVQPVKLLNPVRWFWLLVYVPVFAWACLKANVDVAMRVLSPGLVLRPGIIKIRTSLKSDIARTFLANSITLTPGTMTVEIKDDVLYIHWIDVRTDDPEVAGRMIKGPFEKLLARIFE